ncbi:MAG TPA: tRNA 2-thiouridine(34) synthase MnmA [Phototrophicaceae bacterium]|jgi:tRNA-specific 2-thiouridylase|nr:tRNA 2-thiouridine(34) synthase MnmA [Phototrophicaceae bacterium]
MSNSDIRVVVAMSGGVDSSVAAALLVEQGYDVIGMMMKLWSEETVMEAVSDEDNCSTHNRCCTPEQMNDARRIADKLGIPFYVLDTKDVFRSTIVEYFIDQHRQALTPNPCIECNRHIRFNWLFNNAMALDADYLATGHYARVARGTNGEYQLRKGLDDSKDQSYVLSVLQQEHLAHTLFPIGEYPKPQVREIAARFGLPTASKKDSQDLCFLGDGDYRRFLREYAPDAITPGPIVLKDGTVVGEHTGLANYTIGQRKGLNISYSEPLYVIATNPYRNALVVGTGSDLGQDHLTAKRVSWMSTAPTETFRCDVKIRYKAKPVAATVTPLDADRVYIQFDEPLRDISPGQGAVMYNVDICLGCGIIERETAPIETLPAPQINVILA